MEKELIIYKTKEYIRARMEGEATGHDWWHVLRVYKTSKYIGEKENADMFIVELAALLHDISDWKFNNGNSDIGVKLASEWLKTLEVEAGVISQVANIIGTLSFKGGTVSSFQQTIEGRVVQDADRLDAIGAIGIARTFAYGGYKGREIYNPDIKAEIYKSFDEYKSKDGTTINHFYEKLLLLKDLMNTETGKVLANQRHEFMEGFLAEFYKEWDSF
ncbi:MAG: HD domain-containing protein [Clostridiaceae bacterium]|nr:HD domain-containing protein [Clostridiaceae bacterium]